VIDKDRVDDDEYAASWRPSSPSQRAKIIRPGRAGVSVVARHYGANDLLAVQGHEEKIGLNGCLRRNCDLSAIPGRVIGEGLLPQSFDAGKMFCAGEMFERRARKSPAQFPARAQIASFNFTSNLICR
jgi:hypothetical protein